MQRETTHFFLLESVDLSIIHIIIQVYDASQKNIASFIVAQK